MASLLFFQPGEGVSEKVLKQYCWMYSTFNIPSNFEGNCAKKEQSDNPNDPDKDERGKLVVHIGNNCALNT